MTPQIDMTPQICGHRSFADIFHGRSIPLDLLPALSRKRTKQKHKAQLITIIRSTNVTEVVFFLYF
jgi:3-isopropylmalate dehydratase small subunit